jgi:hypothetical protein
MATKKYEAGGMTDTQTCGGPGKPKCRKKFKSKGKSQETKGSILGTLGAIAGGIGAYGAYKKLKKEQKGGVSKYQGGGSTESKKMADLAKKGAGPIPVKTADGGAKWSKNTKDPKGKKYQKGGSAPHGPGSMTKGTVPPMVNEQAKPQKPKPQRTKSQVPKGWEDGKTAERSTKRYQIGGAPMAPPMPSPKTYPTGNKGIKATPRPQIGGKGNPGNEGYKPYGPRPSSPADYKAKVIERYGSEEAARAAKAIQQKGGTTKKMKTGGMVNPNAKMQADKTAGSKGVKSGVNPKAAASKVARGRSGGTSAAPKKATPGRK